MKALPVIGAISAAKDVYDAGQWLLDRYQTVDAKDIQWGGPVGNPNFPTSGPPGTAI